MANLRSELHSLYSSTAMVIAAARPTTCFGTRGASAGGTRWPGMFQKTWTAWRARRGSGTSYAVAITAGVASLWLAHHDRRKLVNRYGANHIAGLFKELLTNLSNRLMSGGYRSGNA